jgi:SSS family solute:Na+ symporter
LQEGQKGVLICGALKLLGPLYLVLPGIIAFHLYAGTDIKADTAYGQLVRDVLPGPLTGLFAAVMVGAILSSYNSALNSTTTLFSLGIYKPMINKEASEENVVKSGKIFGLFISMVSMIGAPMLIGQASIFGYLQKMNGLYFIPIFAVVVVGIVFKRVPPLAAKVGLIVGFAAIALGYFVFPDVVNAMHEFHFLGAVFTMLVLIMLLIGFFQPLAEPWEQQYSGDVEMTPWVYARPMGLALVVIVLLIYAGFADFSVL